MATGSPSYERDPIRSIAIITDMVKGSVDYLFTGAADAGARFGGLTIAITDRIPKLNPPIPTPALAGTKAELARVFTSGSLPQSPGSDPRMDSITTYLTLTRGRDATDQDLATLPAISEAITLGSHYALYGLLGKNRITNLPPVIHQTIIDKFTISPDTIGDPSNKVHFMDRFKPGSVYLLDRTVLTGDDLQKLFFMPIAFDNESVLNYSPAYERYFYFIGQGRRGYDCPEQQNVLRAITQRGESTNVFIHDHPLPTFEPSPSDDSTSRQFKDLNPDCRSFIAALVRRDLNLDSDFELAFREFGSYKYRANSEILTPAETANIINGIVRRSQQYSTT